MNKKGSVLTGLMVYIVGVVASTGILFSGGAANTAGSGMLLAVTALTSYSQMPHVVKDFRVKKAIGYCQDGQVSDVLPVYCVDYVASLSAVQIMDIIRDDEPA
jgi:hypothetical protein